MKVKFRMAEGRQIRSRHGYAHGNRDEYDGGRDVGRKHHPVAWIFLFLIVGLLALATVGGLKFYRQAKQVQAHEQKAIAAIQSVAGNGNVSSLISSDNGSSSSASLDNLNSKIAIAQKETKTAQNIAHGRLWRIVAKVPGISNDIANVQGLTDIAYDLSKNTLPQFTTVVQGLKGASFSTGNGQLNMAPVISTGVKLTAVNSSLNKQVEALKKLPTPTIPQIKNANTKATSAITSLSGKINTATGLINSLPNLLGVNGARNYIVVAQTTSEARSGGGLVGSVGTMNATNGVITMGSFHANTEFTNTGSVSNLVTPQQAAALVSNGYPWYGHYINDVSVNPNFPDTAALIRQMWEYQRFGTRGTSGVISLDPVALQQIIRVTGKVTMPNGTVLTGSNTAEYLLNKVYIDIPVAYQNAYFEAVVAQVTRNAFTNMTAGKMLRLADVMSTAGRNRHLYVWSFQKEDQATLRQAGVTGEVDGDKASSTTGIYNEEMVPSKMDWYIRRSTTVTKTGTTSSGGTTYRVTSVIRNTLDSSTAARLPKYITPDFTGKSRLRLYIYPPKGGAVSNLSLSSGTGTQPFSLQGRTIFCSDIVDLLPGAVVTVSYDVTTPAGADNLILDQSPMGIEDPQVTYKY